MRAGLARSHVAPSILSSNTFRGDILSSTCKDCIANGVAIPDCRTCKCNCQTGVFTEKDIQAMAIKKTQNGKGKGEGEGEGEGKGEGEGEGEGEGVSEGKGVDWWWRGRGCWRWHRQHGDGGGDTSAAAW